MEDINPNSSPWRMTSPTVVPEPVKLSRGAEVLMRIAFCSMAGMLVSLGWIVGSSAALEAKSWSVVIGLSSLSIVCFFAGHTRSEVNKARADIAASEARLNTAVEAALQSALTELQALRNERHHRDVSEEDPPALKPKRRRQSRSHHRPPRRPIEAGEVISDEFRIFLEGRESHLEDGPGGLA
jgi:hypothetical protein